MYDYKIKIAVLALAGADGNDEKKNTCLLQYKNYTITARFYQEV